MRRKGPYIIIAFCLSLLLHGALVWVGLSWVVGEVLGDALWAVGRLVREAKMPDAAARQTPPIATNDPLKTVPPIAVVTPKPIIPPPTPEVIPPEPPEIRPEPRKAPPPPPVIEPPPISPPIAELPRPEPQIRLPPMPRPKAELAEADPPKVEPATLPPSKTELPKVAPPRIDPAKVAPANTAPRPPLQPPAIPPELVKKGQPKPEAPDDDEEVLPYLGPDRFAGEQGGTGTAVNSNDLPGEQKARKGTQDQAALARSLQGVIKPLDEIFRQTGGKPAGGGPQGGGGGAAGKTAQRPSDQLVATVGPGGISGSPETVRDPAKATPPPAPKEPQVKPRDLPADRSTAPKPGGVAVEAQKAQDLPVIGIGPEKGVDPAMKARPEIAAVTPGSPIRDPGSERPTTRVSEPETRNPQLDSVHPGAGDVPVLPATRPSSPQLAMAVGPRDLPPGKKQAVDGPPGPGDKSGEGDSLSRSPIRDDAQISDSESDAFSQIGAEMFVRGGVKAKAGRKVRTVKPRLGEHALMDWATIGRAIIVMKVSIGVDGHVTNVKVVRSSGSDSMDLETSLAIYRWWIEPKKGSDGLAIADNVTLTIVWH